jgi:hypothetical protein
VIPAHPLALTSRRTLDERRQVALTRYYLDAGAGGIAVGVHTTQFAIREPRHGLLAPVLELAAETARTWQRRRDVALVAGITGDTRQALAEAALAVDHVVSPLSGRDRLPVHLLHVRARVVHVAELAKRLRARRVRCQARPDEGLDARVEVKSHFGVHVVVRPQGRHGLRTSAIAEA